MKKITKEVINKLTTYDERYNFNVKEYGIVDKKGKFDYISWSYCEMIGNLLDDKFDWDYIGMSNGMVIVKMMFQGKERQFYHPILDFRNKPIEKPNSFDINTGQMRAMSKLFSMMTGIGLSLYTGEDLPEEKTPMIKQDQKTRVEFLLKETKTDKDKILKAYGVYTLEHLTEAKAEDCIKKLEDKIDTTQGE